MLFSARKSKFRDMLLFRLRKIDVEESLNALCSSQPPIFALTNNRDCFVKNGKLLNRAVFSDLLSPRIKESRAFLAASEFKSLARSLL